MSLLLLHSLNIPRKLSNKTQDVVPQCKIVIYDWTTRALALDSKNDSALAKSRSLDVSSQILSASFNKTMGSSTGNFTFTLSNSPNFEKGDWKDIIKRGDWCLIYMSQDGDLTMSSKVGPPDPNAKKLEEAKKLRCIGFIDRVSVKAEISDEGAFDVVYEVSGRDFGVVYEDTTIWHNIFKFDDIILKSIASSELNITGAVSIDRAIKIIHNLFFNPKAEPGTHVNDNQSLLSIALQWLMPRQMLQDIGLKVDKTPFWGEIPSLLSEVAPTSANLAIETPTDFLSGNAWDTLKRMSVPEFHELFTETTDAGLPRLVFRPIPWAINKKKYPTVGKHIKLYKDLPVLTVDAINVIDFNLGEDNHSRYNSFLATVSTSMIHTNDNISFLMGTGFPKNVQDSIKRYGFRPMHVTVDSIIKNQELSNGQPDFIILVEFNHVLYDYWNNAVFAESGEVTLIGQNEIKLGKAVNFDSNTPYIFGKRYYIEGYTDSYSINDDGTGAWIQTVMLTRGFEEQDLKDRANFGTRATDFNHEGEYTPSGSSTSQKSSK